MILGSCLLFPGSKAMMLGYQASSCETYCDLLFFFFNDTATTEIYTLSLHDALPIYVKRKKKGWPNLKPQTWRSKLSRKKTGPGSYSSNDPRSSNILSGREATRGALLPTLPPPPTQKTTVGE